MLSSNKSYKNRKVSLTIHCQYKYFDSIVQRTENRRQKFYFCRLPFAVNVKLNLSNIWITWDNYVFHLPCRNSLTTFLSNLIPPLLPCRYYFVFPSIFCALLFVFFFWYISTPITNSAVRFAWICISGNVAEWLSVGVPPLPSFLFHHRYLD